MDEDEPAVVGGKSVIHHDVHPLPKVPETEVEDARVPIAPALLLRNHLGEGGRGGGGGGAKSEVSGFLQTFAGWLIKANGTCRKWLRVGDSISI